MLYSVDKRQGETFKSSLSHNKLLREERELESCKKPPELKVLSSH